jgi:spermidine synthase
MAQGFGRQITSLFVAGAGGMLFQTTIVRELLILFSGNELSLCAITGLFIIGEALGALLGGSLREKREALYFLSTFLFFSVLFPFSIFLARSVRAWLSIPPSLSLGIGQMLFLCLLCVFPSSFFHGLFFTLSCSFYERMTGLREEAPGRVYFYEMSGTVAGGLLSPLLIPLFNTFTISFIVGLGLSFCSLSLTGPLGVSRPFLLAHIPVVAMLILGVVETERIHSLTVERLWEGRSVVSYKNSPYQNIVVTQEEEEINVFLDGVPYITLPEPDIAEVELISHVPMLIAEDPREVLMIGGLGGPLREVMRHPSVKRVDYVEIDPYLIATVKEGAKDLVSSELSSRLLSIHLTDGRAFVKSTHNRYDCVILCLSEPSTIERNRYFTEEFFLSVRHVLKEGGVFAFLLPGSLSYYTEELKGVNGTIYASLVSAFPSSMIVPFHKNLFLARKGAPLDALPALLVSRLKERGLETRFLSPSELGYLFEQKRQNWVKETITSRRFTNNRDSLPISFLYWLSYLNLSTSPKFRWLFQAARGARPFHLFTGLCALLLPLFFLRRTAGRALCFSLATTGLSSFVSQAILIFSFQTVFGSIYSEIGALFATSLGGMAVASILVTLIMKRSTFYLALFLSSELGLSLFGVCLSLFLPLSGGRASFHALLFISGGFAGMEFPLATGLYRRDRIGKRVAPLYASDLLGGFLGALFSFFLLPALGFKQSLLFLSATKAASAFLILLSRQDINRK